MLGNGSDSNVLSTEEQFVLDNNRSSIGTYRCTAYNRIGTAPNHTIAVDVNCKQFIILSTCMYRSAVKNEWFLYVVLDYVISSMNICVHLYVQGLCR